MLKIMTHRLHIKKADALVYASVLVDLQVSQVVNGVRSVCASFDPKALAFYPNGF